MATIDVSVAHQDELPAAQCFYESRDYGGGSIDPADFVVLAKLQGNIVGVGRLCQQQDLLWLRGMQVAPQFHRGGVGTRILQLLDKEVGPRQCCCLPYTHLVGFYRQAGFEQATQDLPSALAFRLASYLSRGLQVVAMIRPARSRPSYLS